MPHNNNVTKQVNINLRVIKYVIEFYKLAQNLHFINEN